MFKHWHMELSISIIMLALAVISLLQPAAWTVIGPISGLIMVWAYMRRR